MFNYIVIYYTVYIYIADKSILFLFMWHCH